jgi:hypothetical protein
MKRQSLLWHLRRHGCIASAREHLIRRGRTHARVTWRPCPVTSRSPTFWARRSAARLPCHSPEKRPRDRVSQHSPVGARIGHQGVRRRTRISPIGWPDALRPETGCCEHVGVFIPMVPILAPDLLVVADRLVADARCLPVRVVFVGHPG